MTQLHILNGDATYEKFIQTGLNGDVLVWREVLSEGPLAAVLDAPFWQQRADWISKTFEDTPAGYQDKVITELEKLSCPYEEIIMWFEFDLHCQVNLLGVMQLLQQQADLSGPNIYLVSPDSYPVIENFSGIGQLLPDQLEDLYNTRLHLTDYDFTLAKEAWQKYTLFDAKQLQDWLNSVTFWGSLHHLKTALMAQVKRLQTDAHGLNYIAQTLLNLYQHGATSRTSLYEAFWSQHAIYGMGDAELDIYLKELQSRGLIHLND
jgi:hypothetical protein